MQTLAELLRSHATHFKNKTFLVFENQSWTYGQYFARVEKIAQLLVQNGVKKGDPVCLYLPSRPELAFCYHACQLIGAIATPMSAMYKATEINKIATRTGASVLITDTERAKLVRENQTNHPNLKHVLVFGGDEKGDNLNKLLEQNFPKLPKINSSPDDVAALFFTSGTTGEPKGAMQTQGNIMAALRAGDVFTASQMGKEVFIGVLPLFNNFGATVVLNGAYFNGGTLVLHERWDLEAIVKDITTHKISVFFGAPTMFTFILKAYDAHKHNLTSLRLCLAGGALLAPTLVEAFEATLKTKLVNIYGATEVSSYVTATPLLSPKSAGSVGLPIGSTIVSVIDEAGNQLPQGQTGEITIKGDTVGPGYWQDEAATSLAFKNGAWLSGDIGFIDEQNQIHIIDRKKDVIISGGFNIYPIEVEDLLYKSEDIALCALIAMPDEDKGELPVAYVVPVAGKTLSEQEIITYCKANLAAYKAPRRVIFKAELPLGPTGKILKKELRGMVEKDAA